MSALTNICCIFILIGLAVAQTTASLTTEEAAKLKAKAVADCKDKIKDITEEEIDDILVKRIGAKTKQGNCFIACVLKGCEYMWPNNTLIEKNLRDRLDRTKDQAPPEEYPKKIKVLEICKSKEVKEADECVAANSFIVCVIAQRKEFGITTRLW